MKYTYDNMPDKSKEGVMDELGNGLAAIAFHYETVLGVPLEIFEDMLEEKCPTNAHKLRFYMRYRNEKPEIFS